MAKKKDVYMNDQGTKMAILGLYVILALLVLTTAVYTGFLIGGAACHP